MKTTLTSTEFLSLYTGVVMGNDFEVVKSALKKVYGFDPYDEKNQVENPAEMTFKMQEKFRNYIDENYAEIKDVMDDLGEFKPDDDNSDEKVDEYINNFELLFGAEEVDVDVIGLEANAEKTPKTAKANAEVEMTR